MTANPQPRPHRVDRPRDERRYVTKPFLPLRAGQVGRFVGVFNDAGRNVGYCYRNRAFTGPCDVRGVPVGARFRNETIGVTYQFNGGMWHPVPVSDPNGCRYCDASNRVGSPRADHGHSHAQRYVNQPGVGTHGFTEPTDQQRLHRMQWRRYHSVRRGRGMRMPDIVPFTLAAPKQTRKTP